MRHDFGKPFTGPDGRQRVKCRCGHEVVLQPGVAVDLDRIIPGCQYGPPPPPLFRRVLTFAASYATHVVAGSPKATEEEIKARLTICATCDKFSGERCLECGCCASGQPKFFNKLSWADQSCPLGKWQAIKTESQGDAGQTLPERDRPA